MRLRPTIVRPVASLGLAAVLLSACGNTAILDNENLQVKIAEWLQTNYQETATVACPDDRPIKQGDVFNCTAVTDSGSTVTLEVTQTDNTGNVSWNVTSVS